jgi:hypothetical protein
MIAVEPPSLRRLAATDGARLPAVEFNEPLVVEVQGFEVGSLATCGAGLLALPALALAARVLVTALLSALYALARPAAQGSSSQTNIDTHRRM